MANSKWTGIFAFLLGAGLGVAAGLLLAPQKGEELREDLADQLDKGTRRVRAAGRAVGRRAQELADDVQQTVSEAAEAGIRATRKFTRS